MYPSRSAPSAYPALLFCLLPQQSLSLFGAMLWPFFAGIPILLIPVGIHDSPPYANDFSRHWHSQSLVGMITELPVACLTDWKIPPKHFKFYAIYLV